MGIHSKTQDFHVLAMKAEFLKKNRFNPSDFCGKLVSAQGLGVRFRV